MSGFTRPFTSKERANRAENTQNEQADRLADFSTELFQQTAPLRSGTIDILNQVLQGGRPDQMQVFAPEREAVESQFGRARENIIANNPMGGQLNRLLADTDIARAGTLGQLDAEIRRNAFSQALGTGFGAVPQVLTGLNAAGNQFGSVATRNDQGSAGSKSAGGSAIGAIGGIVGAIAACWIAARLYGEGSREFYYARLWIMEGWQGPLADLTRFLYLRYGQWIAARPALAELFRPLFDMAVRRGERYLMKVSY